MLTSKHYDASSISSVQFLQAGCQDLQPAVNDERSERARSEPSVASRRVAAPYGVDGRFGVGKVDFKRKTIKFSARYARKLTTAYVELATLAEPAGDGHLQACKLSHLGKCTTPPPTSSKAPHAEQLLCAERS